MSDEIRCTEADITAHAEAQARYARALESEWRAVAEAFERVARKRKEESNERVLAN